MEAHERLAHAVQLRGSNANALSKILPKSQYQGHSAATIRKYITGDRSMPLNVAERIADFLRVDFDWLALGRGEAPDLPLQIYEAALISIVELSKGGITVAEGEVNTLAQKALRRVDASL